MQLIIGSFFNLDLITEVINFGALFGFVLLNAATFLHILRHKPYKRKFSPVLLIPVIGVLLNFWILAHLGAVALVVGGVWLLLGIVLYFVNSITNEEYPNDKAS